MTTGSLIPTPALIAGAPVIDDTMTGRRRILMPGGGYFTCRNDDQWWYHPGIGRPPVLVTVPGTIDALEDRCDEIGAGR